ncbi:hypothetical protein [Deinococcus frigens]|uniref:hypothetical protein n=1 Tax=Deinococcus frigens TaxID=249403 RepID=UPI000495E33F|nr:hypothetical protein [Deinococcus frigens]
MKPLLRALTLGMGPVVVAAGLGMVGRQNVQVRELSVPPMRAEACTQPPIFKPGYQRRDNYVIPQGTGFKFDSDAWIEADLCSPGTLKITADGDLAGDEDPQLTVVLDATVLASPRFNQERTASVNVPHAGRIYLGFFNDYYLADVRVATLRDIKLTAPDCNGFKSVNVPKESAGNWYPEASAATLVRDMPMTLIPCAAGKLTMRVQGREGNGAFPILTFKQGRKVVKVLQTTSNFQQVRLPLKADLATITVSNAYNETLANRNLNVRRLEFVPDSASSTTP